MATVSVVAVVSPVLTSLVANLTLHKDLAQATPTTSTPPTPLIRPLSVRSVIGAFVTTPDRCPQPKPAAPDQPTRECNITKTAVYDLGPEVLRLDLTNVDSFRNPLTGKETVQMSLTPESARRFGEFTASQVGKQLAFVRDSTVVWGPEITAAIDSPALQFSGDLTPEQARQVARMLRESS